MSEGEAIERFDCFGSRCAVLVSGSGPAGSAEQAAGKARERLLEWHGRFSRFIEHSELSQLNADPRRQIPVSPLMARLAQAILMAGRLTDGLVDGTLLEQVRAAGYDNELKAPLDLTRALELAPVRRPARPSPARAWTGIAVDLESGLLTRSPNVMLDSGGLAKGLFADVLAQMLDGYEGFAIDCGGDLHVGGGLERAIEVQSPFDASTLHTFRGWRAGVATSGIGRRSWIDEHGSPAHHLLDPSTGRPAFTGIVQVTALAPSALQAEIYAKAALLSGPAGARRWLSSGGLIVLEDGSHIVVDPPPVVTVRRGAGALELA